jgi:hypothetical protein
MPPMTLLRRVNYTVSAWKSMGSMTGIITYSLQKYVMQN